MNGACKVIISLLATNSSIETWVTISSIPVLGNISYPITFAPKPLNNFAAVNPILPSPTTPTVQFLISLENIFLSTVKSLLLNFSAV